MNEPALSIHVKRDGVWLHAHPIEVKRYQGAINLNNIVNEMKPGIIKEAFLQAIMEMMQTI